MRRVTSSLGVGLVAGLLLLALAGCGSGKAGTGPATTTALPTTAAIHRDRGSNHRKRHRARHRRKAAHHGHHRHRRRASGVPAADLPDPALTPGAVLTRSAARVCVAGYASRVRDVPDSEKEAVYARYGVAHVPYAHEVDHLVSLELGGSNAITNLWPEPYAGRWGARPKDALENRLHDLVCSGSVALRAAQRLEAAGWVRAYRRYVGAPPAAASAPQAGGAPAGGGSSSGGAAAGCTPGYAPCLPDRAGGDYDCAGGDGNGPNFTATGMIYRVTGGDPYRLDGDGDGLGCD